VLTVHFARLLGDRASRSTTASNLRAARSLSSSVLRVGSAPSTSARILATIDHRSITFLAVRRLLHGEPGTGTAHNA